MEFTVGEIAERIGAAVDGDPDRVVSGVAGLSEAGPGDLTFCAKAKFADLVPETEATAVFVAPAFLGSSPAALLRVDDPYQAFLRVLKLFHPEVPARPRGVHPTALIDAGVRLGDDVAVGAFCVVESGAVLGDGATLAPGVYVGPDSVIGKGSYIHPNVTVREGVTLGERVIVHSGSVLGSDGFGYLSRGGVHEKVPQIGRLVVEDDVEIGANVAIDRATLGETRIARGVKIDNLVHIAHNVTVGEHSLLVAQVGISGSTRVGKHVVLAGQAGIVGHIGIGDGAMVGAQAGVTKTVGPGARVSGYPAMDHDRARRLHAFYRRLPDLFEDLKRLEERVRELEREKERIL